MLSKKLRFTIFDRDAFTCQYCGEKPPKVILHVDHIVSRKDGGGDEEMNLITSCKDCNLGKSSRSVDLARIRQTSFKKEIEELDEKKAQLEAYYEYVRKKKDAELHEVDVFQRCWQDCSNGESSLTDSGLENMRKLSKRYSTEMIFEAIAIAWNKTTVEPESKFPYMCGVLRNMKLRQENPELAEEQHEQNRLVYLARKTHAYVDERFLRAHIVKMPLSILEEMIPTARNWSQLREYITSYVTDAEN